MKIEHCAIWVSDIERTRLLFETYFGCKASERYNNARGFSSYFMTFGDSDDAAGHARIELMQSPDVEAALPPSLGHIAISLGSKEAVDSFTRRLVADGHKLISGPRHTGDGYYESCFTPFNEFILELTV